MFYDCDRCGRTCIPEGTWLKCKERGYVAKCADCRAGRSYRVSYGEDYCVPHQGLFNMDDYPVNKAGQRLYGSEALCGNRDCIRETHYATEKLVKFAAERRSLNKPRPATGRKRGRPVGSKKLPSISDTPAYDRMREATSINLIMALAEAQNFNRKVATK